MAQAGKEWTGPERPDFLPGVESWYEDFWELSTDRQIGMAAGPIPRASIIEHTRDWPQDDADMFHLCMRRMDGLYLNFKPGKAGIAADDNSMSPQDKLKRIFGDRID